MCEGGLFSAPFAMTPPSLQASTVLLGGFLCFSEREKIWKSSLFDWFAPCKWQDGFCMLTNYITLWITTSQEYVFASNTSGAGISQFASIPVAMCTSSHLTFCKNHITSYYFQNSSAHAGKTKYMSHEDLKSIIINGRHLFKLLSITLLK